MSTQPQHMANHWWWRPGWRPGRTFYTWHLTFQDASDVHRLAETYRQALGVVPGLDLVPDQWLHLTMQGIGFVDEVPEEEARAIADAAASRLRAVPAFELTLRRPEITPEAVRWEAEPGHAPAAVRAAVRAAIADVRGDVPEAEDGFKPHVSIAYSSASGSSEPVAEALASVEAEPATALVRGVQLIALHRDNQMYEWKQFAEVPLD
ncbi:2'-5' RNA ligase family protein [Streptomyces roseifaciens]